ncbi:MAG: hypothetical protein KatS3mg050_4950 [Litorilinea sp.]|nr:MAG: hypothetical protein KatS3mg050_4950 [Litorilinea sp.]
MQSTTFNRFAGLCAILTGIAILSYSVAFIVIARRAPEVGGLLSALFLLLNGLLATPVFTTIYARLRETDTRFALWALLLSILGALGAAIHGGYDLANALNPPALPADLSDGLATLPSQIDPRGLLTFGVTGIALLVVAWLMGYGRGFPNGLPYLTYLSAVLLIVIYLGRLTILNPANPALLIPTLLAGFVVNPIWYIWLGLALWRDART